jgi:hypothetical protein
MKNEEKRQWDKIQTQFVELAAKIWPLIHLYTAQEPWIPPIVLALPNPPPHRAYPMTETQLVAMFEALSYCTTIAPADFFCGKIPPGHPPFVVPKAGAKAPAAVGGAKETQTVFRPFRVSELQLSFSFFRTISRPSSSQYDATSFGHYGFTS